RLDLLGAGKGGLHLAVVQEIRHLLTQHRNALVSGLAKFPSSGHFGFPPYQDFGQPGNVRRRSNQLLLSSSARWRPIIASLLMTSSRDLRPRLRTFIISSSVLEIRSSTVLMLARLRQLKLRTERS